MSDNCVQLNLLPSGIFTKFDEILVVENEND